MNLAKEDFESLDSDFFISDNTTNFKFRNERSEKLWKNFVVNSLSDKRQCEIINFTRVWGKYMQKHIFTKNQLPHEVINNSKHFYTHFGLTENDFKKVIKILSAFWCYGGEVKKFFK